MNPGRAILFVLWVVALVPLEATTKVGTSSGQFLKIGVGARAAGMAGSFNASASDVTAVYWNPAGLAGLSKNEFIISHIDWLAGISYDFLAMALPLTQLRGTAAVFVSSLTVPEEEVRTIYEPEGTGEFFDAGNLALGFSYAMSVTDRFSIGFVGKYVQESIWSMRSSAVALDIGTLYRSDFRNLRIGIGLSNFGTKMKLEGRANLLFVDPDPFIEGNIETIRAELEMEKWDLPLYVRTGAALELMDSKAMRATYSVDMLHPSDNREFINSGIEIGLLNEALFIRGGYQGYGMDEAEGGLAFGAGIAISSASVGSLSVDYAVTDFSRLSYVHQISVKVGF